MRRTSTEKEEPYGHRWEDMESLAYFLESQGQTNQYVYVKSRKWNMQTQYYRIQPDRFNSLDLIQAGYSLCALRDYIHPLPGLARGKTIPHYEIFFTHLKKFPDD